jgi:hypothetical protein
MGQVPTKLQNTNAPPTKDVCIYKYNRYANCRDQDCTHEKIKIQDVGMYYVEEPVTIINCNNQTCICHTLSPKWPVRLIINSNEEGEVTSDIVFTSVSSKSDLAYEEELKSNYMQVFEVTDEKAFTSAEKYLSKEDINDDNSKISNYDMVNEFYNYLSPKFKSLPIAMLPTKEKLSAKLLSNWFLYWRNTNPMCTEKYLRDSTIPIQPLINEKLYNECEIASIFEIFIKLDIEERKDKALFMTIWTEDGASFQIHRYTPEQRIRFNSKKYPFMFTVNPYKFCDIGKIVKKAREDKTIFKYGLHVDCYLFKVSVFVEKEEVEKETKKEEVKE